MKKYELVKRSAEINWKERKTIAPGCTMNDPEPEKIKEFESLEEAQKELKNYKSDIHKMSGNIGTLYEVTEYMIEENEYDEENEWISGGDVWDFSDMTIEVVEKPSYETILTCSNMEEAEEAVNNYEGDGEVYISF